MSKVNYFGFHIGDYLSDTMGFDNTDHGIYLLLLLACYKNGSLPVDHDVLIKITLANDLKSITKMNAILRRFFTKNKTTYTHKRVSEELIKIAEKSKKGKKAADDRWGNNDDDQYMINDMIDDDQNQNDHDLSNASHEPITMSHEPDNISNDHDQVITRKTHDHSLDDRFNRFWLAYPRKEAKARAQQVWNKLKPTEDLLESMLVSIERMKKTAEWQKDGGTFIPHPATWLNQKRWEDEGIAVIAAAGPLLPAQEVYDNRIQVARTLKDLMMRALSKLAELRPEGKLYLRANEKGECAEVRIVHCDVDIRLLETQGLTVFTYGSKQFQLGDVIAKSSEEQDLIENYADLVNEARKKWL